MTTQLSEKDYTPLIAEHLVIGSPDQFVYHRGCCLVAKARTLATAATGGSKPFELITYSKTDHDFVKGGAHYNSTSHSDALQRTAAKLKEFFGS